MKETFNLWAFGDAHVGSDLKHGRESLATALMQSEQKTNETEPFSWDLAVNVGDLSGEQGLPTDAEGQEIVRQFSILKKHDRHDIYSVCGNHDRSGLKEPSGWWFQKWIDPVGANTRYSGIDPERRPYPVTGTWERYRFQVDNLLFLMMSDINEPTQTIGRGDLGGNPSGVVSQETFNWWKDQVENNQDKIIISVHHYMLKDTTVASGAWEGMEKDEKGQWTGKYHGYKERGTPDGASYLYWVGSRPDAQAFEKYLETHPGAIDLWIGGHTHTNPDDTSGGKSHIETRWQTHFVNCSALTRYHVNDLKYGIPMSRLIQFQEGNDQITIRCYMHSGHYRQPGWYDDVTRVLKLSKPFRMDRS